MTTPLPTPTAEPFQYLGKKGTVLLFHGYTGSPYEVRTIGEALSKEGFGSLGPLLAGHAKDCLQLNSTKANQWIQDGLRAFDDLPKDGVRIVGGLSMGALLATIVAANRAKDVDGLILLSPAFVLQPIGRMSIFLAKVGIHFLLPQVAKRGGGSDIADPQAKEVNPSYSHMPIKGLIQFEELREQAVRMLPEIKCPTFAAFGKEDSTVAPKAAARALTKLDVPHFEQHLFRQSKHILPLDFERSELLKWIISFCERIYESKSKETAKTGA